MVIRGVALPDDPLLGRTHYTVGLIDGGVDTSHVTLRGNTVHLFGCGEARVPSAHGTAVPSLLAGSAGDFHGAAPQAELFAADVYCGLPAGGAVDRLAAALGWMARERVAVINVSLVGPRNALLERVVASLVSRGFLIVAAVGNDGKTLFESLVRPKLGRVPAAAARIHGLTWTQLSRAPTWPEVVDDLADALAGRRILAWNAAFDERLVVQSSRAWAIPHPLPGFECAMRAYAVCRGVGSGGLRLSRAAAVEGVLAGSQSHRGGADAALTLAVLRAVHLRQARAA